MPENLELESRGLLRKMDIKRVCPKCGRVTDEFIGPLCKECYVKEYGVARIPSRLTFVYCTECGSYKYQGRWNPGLNTLEDTLKEFVFIALTNKIKPTEYIDEAWIEKIDLFNTPGTSSGLLKASVKIGGRSGDVTVYEEKIVEITLSPTLCPKCLAKRSKTSFEAVVQIRGFPGRLSEILKKDIKEFLRNEVESKLKDSIVEIKDVKEGFDLMVYDQTSARIIASKLRKTFLAKVIESHKVIGRRADGKRKSRVTLSVRVLDLEPGSVILIDNSPLLFLGRTRRGLEFIDMSLGKEVTLSAEEIWKHHFKKYEGEQRVNIKEKRLLLISRNNYTTIFLDVDKNYQDYLEYPSSKVFSPFVELIEGNEYIAYMFKDMIFIKGH